MRPPPLCPTEVKDYQVVGEEVVVPDMHTRKKLMFDKVRPLLSF